MTVKQRVKPQDLPPFLWDQLTQSVQRHGGTADNLDWLREAAAKQHINTLAKAVRAHTKIEVSKPYPVTLRGKTLKGMVKAAKFTEVTHRFCYDHSPEIGNATSKRERVVLVSFGLPTSCSQATKRIKPLGLLPGRVEHLLALHAQHPKFRNKFGNIVAPMHYCDCRTTRHWAETIGYTYVSPERYRKLWHYRTVYEYSQDMRLGVRLSVADNMFREVEFGTGWYFLAVQPKQERPK
jgi:hypothetical protein